MSEIATETLQTLIDIDGAAAGYPKYQRIYDAVADGIRSGRLQPGQRIPPETTLCKQLPVSLGTLQKAFAKLAASGLVVRQRKAGTFIADRRTQAAETFVFRFRDPATGAVRMPFVRAIAVDEDRSPGPWRDVLGARRLVRLDRLLWVGQDPPAFASVYFAHRHGRELLAMPLEQLHGSSTHRWLLDRFNLPTLRFEHRIGCRELSADACSNLMVPAGTVGTVWDVADYSIQDKPSLFQRLQLAPGHRPLQISEVLPA